EILPAALPDGFLNSPYSQTLTASTTATGTFAWSVSSGSLPSGLTLDTAATGTMSAVSGTPSMAGSSTFSITAGNGTSSSTQSYTLNIGQSGTPSGTAAMLEILPAALPDGFTDNPYSQILTASTTATGTFNWFVYSGSLPAGLSLDTAATGTMSSISGTPTVAGSSTFAIGVTNSAVSSTQAYVLNIGQSSTTAATSTPSSTFTGGGNNGQIAVVAVDRIQGNLSAGNTATTIAAHLTSQNGANANDVTVHVQLTQNGTVVADASYPDVNVTHDSQSSYQLATQSNLPVGTYTIAVVVYNGDGTLNASFPDLGTIVVQ
ncbi:MAG: hypothetical protein KGJ13_04465, partial [Patescibacteria group bacterium]|nr:hypothetical protein [Patescibacteria group bacterium]